MSRVHDREPVLEAGTPLAAAEAAAILVHGRGARPEDILKSCATLLDTVGFAFLAPAAADNAWYPNPFTAPTETNEPWLSSSLARLDQLMERVENYVAADQVILLGFSQGACLTLEYAARRPRRYGAVVGLSGALIGPPGEARAVHGSLDGTRVLLSSSDPDPYVSADLVRASGEVLGRMGGDIQVRFYPDMGHTISAAEIEEIRQLMATLTRREEEAPI